MGWREDLLLNIQVWLIFLFVFTACAELTHTGSCCLRLNVMKKLMVSLVLGFVFVLISVMPANAVDATAGGKIFTANCSACHAGG